MTCVAGCEGSFSGSDDPRDLNVSNLDRASRAATFRSDAARDLRGRLVKRKNPIHIVAGALAVVFGFAALFVKKGGTVHRRSGMLFVYAMLVMGVTASILEFLQSAAATNVFAALMTVYFVGTALTTVRPASRWTRVINAAALTVACGLALVAMVGGVKALNSPGLASGGVPFRTIGVMSFILAAVLLLSAAGDVRILRSGMPRGAAGSFFSIRERVAKILPEPFTSGPMRALPIVLLFGAMFYWLWKVRHDSMLARATEPVTCGPAERRLPIPSSSR